MNDFLHTEDTYSLTRGERIRMRRTLYSYMEMTPRQGAAAGSREWVWSWNALYSPRPLAFMLIAVLFASSAGVSYAAEDALPGDVLYPIKTGLNEPVAGVLAVTPAAKIAWASQVASERIKEAATLAAEGRLSASAQEAIQTNFDAHADLAVATLQEEASSSPQMSAQIAVGFEAQLSAYRQVLAQVSLGSASSSLDQAIETQQHRLASLQEKAQERLLFARGTISATSSIMAASSMREAAKRQLSSSLELAQQNAGALDASSSAEVALALETASSSITGGETQLSEDAAPQALHSFQRALTDAAKLSAFLQTSASIHQRTGKVIGAPQIASTSTVRSRAEERISERQDAAGSIHAATLAPGTPGTGTASSAVSATTSQRTKDAEDEREGAHSIQVLPLALPLP